MPDAGMSNLTPGVPSALSPLVRRIVAPNPGPFTGPGTNTYLVGIDEVAVIDPGPDDQRHIDAIVGASMQERVRWVLLTHTHPDHAPGTARLVKATGAEVLAYGKRLDKDSTIVPDRVIGEGDTIEGTEFGLEVLHTPGPRPQPPLLPARGGTRPLHRRHRARRHVLGGRARNAAATWPSTSRRSGGWRSCGCRRLAPGHGDVIEDAAAADPGVRRAPPRPGAPGAGAAEEQGPAQASPTWSRTLYADRELHPKLVEAARVAGARPPPEAQGRGQGHGHVGQVGLEARLSRRPAYQIGPSARETDRPHAGVAYTPRGWCQQDVRGGRAEAASAQQRLWQSSEREHRAHSHATLAASLGFWAALAALVVVPDDARGVDQQRRRGRFEHAHGEGRRVHLQAEGQPEGGLDPDQLRQRRRGGPHDGRLQAEEGRRPSRSSRRRSLSKDQTRVREDRRSGWRPDGVRRAGAPRPEAEDHDADHEARRRALRDRCASSRRPTARRTPRTA